MNAFMRSSLVAALLVFAPGVAAQNGSITGQVIDAVTRQPIAGAQVFLPVLDIGVLSQPNGSYVIVNVPIGNRVVTVQRSGYAPMTMTVAFADGQRTVLDFRLTEQAAQPDAAGPPRN